MVERVELVAATTRAALFVADEAAFAGQWPAFIGADAGVGAWVARRAAYFGGRDFHAMDPAGRVVAVCWGVPMAWDGDPDALPGGYTESLSRSGIEHEAGTRPVTLVVMGAMVRSGESGRGWAGATLAAVRDVALANGLARVVAPLRPAAKAAHPGTDIAT